MLKKLLVIIMLFFTFGFRSQEVTQFDLMSKEWAGTVLLDETSMLFRSSFYADYMTLEFMAESLAEYLSEGEEPSFAEKIASHSMVRETKETFKYEQKGDLWVVTIREGIEVPFKITTDSEKHKLSLQAILSDEEKQELFDATGVAQWNFTFYRNILD